MGQEVVVDNFELFLPTLVSGGRGHGSVLLGLQAHT